MATRDEPGSRKLASALGTTLMLFVAAATLGLGKGMAAILSKPGTLTANTSTMAVAAVPSATGKPSGRKRAGALAGEGIKGSVETTQ